MLKLESFVSGVRLKHQCDVALYSKGFKWIEHNNHPLYWVNNHKTWLTRQNLPWSCHFLLFFYIVLVTIMKPSHMNVQKLTNHSRGLNDICVWVGPAPPTLSSLYSLHAAHLRGNSSLLGTNVTIPGQKYRYSSWHHFHSLVKELHQLTWK